jgi:hypothetical protein
MCRATEPTRSCTGLGEGGTLFPLQQTAPPPIRSPAAPTTTHAPLAASLRDAAPRTGPSPRSPRDRAPRRRATVRPLSLSLRAARAPRNLAPSKRIERPVGSLPSSTSSGQTVCRPAGASRSRCCSRAAARGAGAGCSRALGLYPLRLPLLRERGRPSGIRAERDSGRGTRDHPELTPPVPIRDTPPPRPSGEVHRRDRTSTRAGSRTGHHRPASVHPQWSGLASPAPGERTMPESLASAHAGHHRPERNRSRLPDTSCQNTGPARHTGQTGPRGRTVSTR